MNHTKRTCFIIFALLVCIASTAFASQTYTINEDEYKLLQKYRRLEEIKSIIDAEYLFEYDEERLLEGMAQGMLSVLGDNYTFYYDNEQMQKEQESLNGEYCGIGVEVQANTNDMTITIRRVFHGGAAQKVGILPEDKIIGVNGEEVNMFDLSKAVSMMRGEEGGEVELVILRGKEILRFTCIRSFVENQVISSEILDDSIGYIRIYGFEGNAIDQFATTVQDFINQDVKGVVLDLRDNLGGFVPLATKIADVFIDKGIITIEEDKFGRTLPVYAKEGAWEIPLVVLVNGYSASSAEIIAAALQENDIAKLVGTQTFGKGIYQALHEFLGDGTGMQITAGYWLTPKGNNIYKVGITPDYVVELDEDALDDNFNIIREKDKQLNKGIEILMEQMQQQ